jgi:hypothetical protein
MEIGHEIWYLECKEPLLIRVTYTTVSRVLTRCKLDLVGAREVRWDKGGTVRAEDYIFSLENETKIINFEQNLWYTTESASSQKSRVC